MDTPPLITFAILALLGAYLFARMEAQEIHRRNQTPTHKELPHWILVIMRLGLAVWAKMILYPAHQVQGPWARLILLSMLLLYMGAIFGPVHRLALNLTRMFKYPQESRTITWYHLRKKGYDWMLAFIIPNEKIRFMTLCLIEALVAAEMYVQLN